MNLCKNIFITEAEKNKRQHSWSKAVIYHDHDCYICGRKIKNAISDLLIICISF